MTARQSRYVSSVVIVIALLWGAWPAHGAWQEQAAIPDVPTRMKGTWILNKGLSSTPPPEPAPDKSAAGRGRQGRGAEEPKDPITNEELQLRAAVREVQPPPAMLIISTTPADVTLMAEDGARRTFTTDGKRQQVQLAPSISMFTTTTWTANGLSQNVTAGLLRLTRTWAVSDQGDRLIVTVRMDTRERGASPPVTFVYDRAR